MNINDSSINEIRVPVPPEPLLEDAVGYCNSSHTKYLRMWWERCGDEAMISDGRMTMTGYYEGYLAYIRHSSVNLTGYKLGDSDNEAQNCLIIDLFERKAFIAPKKISEKLLSEQWSKSPAVNTVLSMTHEDVVKRIQEMLDSLESTATFEGLMAGIEESEHYVFLREEWLDGQ